MRLSDAIALGRTLALPWEPGNRGGGRMCALMLAGLAASGNSCDWRTNLPFMVESFDGEHPITVPCGCTRGEWLDSSDLRFGHRAIMHMFNHHVSTVGDWTLDQLIDWVRSIEPPELEIAETLEVLTLAEELASIT
jgi:hypothetical protein